MKQALSLLMIGGVAAIATKSSPVEKVIELISDLKESAESEMAAEQEVYDKYSCFCKDNTDDKSTAILDSQTKIDELAAAIQEGVGTRDRLASEIADLTAEIATLDSEMKEEKVKHLKDRTHREAVIADLEKAVFSLEGAIKAVEESKAGGSLLAVKSVVKKNLMMAEMLGMASAQKVGNAFLQGTQEPDYEFHSGGILDTLNELNDDFSKRLSDNQADLDRAIKAHEELMTSKQNARDEADTTKTNKEDEKASTIEQLGKDKEDITSERQSLSLSQTYLKDLTKTCELKAREFDQRNGMRKSELAALSAALDILENKVKGVEGKRTFLNQAQVQVKTAVTADFNDDDMSFVQKKMSMRAMLKNHRHARVISALKQTANKLHSFELLKVADKMTGPFDKVKKLIAQLIERLLTEAKEEATQKGWCDSETKKATKERDYKFEAITKLNADLEENEATLAQAEADIERLTEEIKTTEDEQAAADDARAEEKDNNTKTLKDARDGLEAVSDALKILKDFYKGEHGVGGANSATVSMLQASPITEDEPESFSGAYQGNQDSASGILGLLATIKSDFQHTIEVTSDSEKEAAAAHVKFTRESKTFLAGANTELKNAENTKKSMTHAINTGMEDLKNLQGMMDAAVKTLEDLQQPCVDTGMSFEERKKKREDEIAALKTALCQLDPEQKEAECM